MPSTDRPARRTAVEPFDDLLNQARSRGIPTAIRWYLKRRAHPLPDPSEVGALHERLLDELQGSRRTSGAYYTPSPLVELLLDHALTPVLTSKVSEILGRTIDRPTDLAELPAPNRPTVAEAILSTTVLDPACGAGAFLQAAADRLFRWLRSATPAHLTDADLRSQIAGRCLFGVDSDESAVLLTRYAIGEEGRDHVYHGDSLLDQSPWPMRRFDVVVGNPPFANAIEGLVDQSTKERLAKRYPDLRGTADLSFYFLAAAHGLAKENGAVGLVMPRTVLSAPAAVKLRERLLRERPPSFLHVPTDPMLFPGANVFISLVAFRKGDGCIVFRRDGSRETTRIDSENWWRAIHSADEPNVNDDRPSVSDVFDVHASMTAGEAYVLLPFLHEGGEDAILRFATTGLIDPGVCLWGTKICRYLGKRFMRPTFDSATLPDPLARRVTRMRRPKILVAGLSNRVEAFLDVRGDHVGAVSTYSILHPDDDLNALGDLCVQLNGDAAADLLRCELGATALGGGRITLTKRFLKALRLPITLGAARVPAESRTRE
jgi:hypothetical protein